MTTAHRPTWNSAKGQANPGGIRTVPSTLISAKDTVPKLQLKRRNLNPLLQSRDILKDDLKNKEKFLDKQIQLKLKSLELNKNSYNLKNNDIDLNEKDSNINKTHKINKDNSNQNSDEEISYCEENKFEDFESDSNKNEEEDEEDEENDEELLLEYQKILEEKKKKDLEKQKSVADKLISRSAEEMLMGNSSFTQNYSLKKKWYENTTFTNQAKIEKSKTKRFVNDTIRSDFFRNFINENIQ
jgi:protein CWC15